MVGSSSVCAFLTTITSAGVRSSPQVLILPLQEEFGWSRALIAMAISMNLLLFGVAAPISGYLIDRYGPRKIMLASLSLLIVGVSGTIAMDQFWQFFLVWGVIVGVGAGGVGSVLTATVGNRWFVARRGLALGVLGSASSTGQLIFLPFFMAMIAYSGWRIGSMTLIVIAILLLPLIFLFMRDDPADVGLEPYGSGQAGTARTGGTASLRGMSAKNATITAREVVGNPTFWLLCGSFFVCGGTANGLIGTHLIPHEIEIGIPQVAAASLVGIMGALNIVGTTFSGWMIDRVQPHKWLALVYALRGASLLLLPFVRDFSGLVVFAVIYGLDWFATVPPSMAITADTFGQAECRQGLWLDFYVSPNRRGDHGFGRGRDSRLCRRLQFCLSLSRRDRDDRSWPGAPDQAGAQEGGTATCKRAAGGGLILSFWFMVSSL